MKKRFSMIIALLLSIVLLSGCCLPVPPVLAGGAIYIPVSEPVRELDKFSDIEYKCPDVEAVEVLVDELTELLEKSLNIKEIVKKMDEITELFEDFQTMYALADIRNCQDTGDSFYAQEYRWMLEADSAMEVAYEKLLIACARSKHRPWLEKFYFSGQSLEEYASAYSGGEGDKLYEKYMELSRREGELIAQYRKLSAESSIEMDGKLWDLNEYLAQADDMHYRLALEKYYEQYSPLYGELFIEMVQLRRQYAKYTGDESYAHLQYRREYSRSYSPEQAEIFMENVKKYISVMYDKNIFYHLSYTPTDETELYRKLETASEGLGGKALEAFRFMAEHELYDFRNSPEKADVSFQTYLKNYEVPYMFISPMGDAGDYITVFHEYGHFLDSYIRYNASESIDLSECFSQAMQFLCVEQLELSMSEEEIANLRWMNFADMMSCYAQQTALAEFEHRAYEMEDLSVEKLNELYLQLSKEYGFYSEFMGELWAYLWIDTPHLFEMPFYVISYPVSATAALEIYQLELESEGAGMELFTEMSGLCLVDLMESLEAVGLQSPMDKERIIEVSEFLREEKARLENTV